MVNKLFLVSGHSGGGKTTVMRSVMTNEIISFTTRGKRTGEQEGKDYKYITIDDFNNMKDKGKLIEFVNYNGNYYGIDSEELNYKLSKGDAFCIVDYHGMEQLKNIYNNCCTIFLYNTSTSQAAKQMKIRGDKDDAIISRLKTYSDELANRKHYDYVIRNNAGKLENTIEIVKNIIQAEVNK